MKIAQIVPSLLPTGPVRVALDLAEGFRQLGHEVTVFYFDEKPGAVLVPNSVLISFFQSIDFSAFDVVHTHGLRPDAYRFFRVNHPNTITTLHNYAKIDLTFAYGATVARIFAPLWRILVKRHRVRVALSVDMQQYYGRERWSQPIAVIPNSRPLPSAPPDLALEKQVKEFAAGRFILGNISHYNPRKGLRQVVDSLKSLEDCCFIHIGTGQEELAQIAKEAGVMQQCLFLPPRPDAANQIALVDVFVLPSYSEGFPLALLEALAAKVPVLASAIPVFTANFPEKVVKTFQLDDLSDFKESLREVLTTRETRAQEGHEWYATHFTPRIIASRYLELYGEK